MEVRREIWYAPYNVREERVDWDGATQSLNEIGMLQDGWAIAIIHAEPVEIIKQEKDERRSSNGQHRTSNVGVASVHLLNKIETPKA